MAVPVARSRTGRRAVLLAAVILVQTLCAVFFLGDVVGDILSDGKFEGTHKWVEIMAGLAMIVGVAFLSLEFWRVISRVAVLETATRAAQGEMAEVIETFFDDWALTASERDVALLMLKGIENDEIARIRGTATGTVRAQCTAVFRKAGVDGRPQLFSIFMEELLAGAD